MATSALQLQPVVNVPALYSSAFITDPASKFTERSAEEEFLTIRLKVCMQFISQRVVHTFVASRLSRRWSFL
jgi:hypothetical protein